MQRISLRGAGENSCEVNIFSIGFINISDEHFNDAVSSEGKRHLPNLSLYIYSITYLKTVNEDIYIFKNSSFFAVYFLLIYISLHACVEVTE